MSLLLLLSSGAGAIPPAPVVALDDALVLFSGIDRSAYVLHDSIQITFRQNERSIASLILNPGFIPTQYEPCVIYDVDGVTIKFSGIVLLADSSSLEQGSSLHRTTVSLVDAMVFTDWCFWEKTFTAPVQLLTVLSHLVVDKLGAYGIFLDPLQDIGDTLEPFTIGANGVGQKVSEVLRNLANACNPPRVVQMGPFKELRILVPGTNAMPFNISDATPHCLDLNWSYSDFTPANKVTLVCGPSGTGTPTQTWYTDGISTSFEVDIQAVPGSLSGGTARETYLSDPAFYVDRTVSPPGLGGYYIWDTAVGKGTLSTGAAPASGWTIALVYVAQYPFSVVATSGATPVIEAQFTDPDQLLLAPAQAAVNGALTRLNQSPRTATILTIDAGYQTNRSISITLTVRDILGASFTITEVHAALTAFFYQNRRMWLYTVRATESTVYQGSYLDQARQLFGASASGGPAIAAGGGAGGVSGNGTTGLLPKWTAAAVLGNSILSESAGVVTAAGTLAATTFDGALATTHLTGTLMNSTVSLTNVNQYQSALSIGGSQIVAPLSTAVQDSITRLGTVTSGVWNAGAGTFDGNVNPSLTDTYDLGTSSALWREAYISQINAVLFAKQTQSLYGGWLAVTKNSGTFASAVGSSASVIDFGQAMTNNQFVLVRAADAGGTLTEEYIQVVSLVSGTFYNVTRNLSGGGAKNWTSGTSYAVRGVSGDGWVELNAYDTPRMSVFTQGSAYNNSVENVRIGHLTGMPNSSSGIGVYMGDATNYFRWNGTAIKIVSAGVTLDDSGLTVGTGPSAFDLTAAVKFNRESAFGVGAANVYGLWTQSSGNAYQDLVLENYADRGGQLGAGSAKASVYIKATGWSSGASPGSATTLAQIRVQSEVGVSAITIQAINTILTGTLGVRGRIGPTQITSNQNDYNPTDLATAFKLVIDSDAARDITGIAAQADGHLIWIFNWGAFPITLKHQSASSSVANRFYCANSADVVIRAGGSVLILEDTGAFGTGAWIVMGA